MCTAVSSALASASCTSQGNSPDSSISAARGAILSSARARTASRRASCSSDSANAGKSRLITPMVGRVPWIYAVASGRRRDGSQGGRLAASAGPAALPGPCPQGSALGQRLVPQLLLEAPHPGQQRLVAGGEDADGE